VPLAQFLLSMMPDASGNPLSAGKLYFYEVGTSDQKTVYSDDDETTAYTQPIVLDAAGTRRSNPVYWTGKCKLDIYTSADVLIASIPVVGSSLYAQDVLIDQTLSGGAHDDFSATNVDAVLAAAVTSVGGNNWYYKSQRGTAGANTYAQKIEVKLRRVVDLADYFNPASPPSTFDAALDNAIADLGSGGGAIFFPASTYRIDSAIVINNLTNIHFFGEGRSSIITQRTTTAADYNLFELTGTSTGCSFARLQLQGTGTNATTAAIGISATIGCEDLHIHDVYFSGTASGKGFNSAIQSYAPRTNIHRCQVDRVQHTSNGRPIYLVTGAHDSVVSECYVDNSDGLAVTGIIVGGADRCRISGCRVNQATAYGIWVLLSDKCQVVDCNVSNCTSAGIWIGGSDDCTVSNCSSSSNATDGIHISYSGTVPTLRCKIVDCHLINNTRNGLRVVNDAADAATIPDYLTVDGNTIHGNGQEGIWTAGDYGSYTNNVIIENSATTPRGWAAIEVTTLGAGNIGGNENYFNGNRVRELAGTTEHLTCIRIRDAAGTGVTNVNTTQLGINDFPAQAANGTPSSYIYGGNIASPRMVANICADGAQRGYVETGDGDFDLGAAANEGYSGATISNRGATATRTVTLPPLVYTDSQYQGYEFLFVREAAFNLIIAPAGANTIIAADGTTGNITLVVNETSPILRVHSKGNTWYAEPFMPHGVATLIAGTVTVACLNVTAGSHIFVSRATLFIADGHLTIGTIIAGTSFVITSDEVSELSLINWWIAK